MDLGSGQGSVTTAGYVGELPALVDAIAAGKLNVETVAYSLSKVEEVWQDASHSGHRIVFVPQR